MKKGYKIICSSLPHTASTLLANCIYGFLYPHEPLELPDSEYAEQDPNRTILKTHNIDLSMWEKKFEDYDVFFIMSERRNRGYILPDKFRNLKNVVIFDFDELNETENYNVKSIVLHVYSKIKKILPTTLDLKINDAITRIENMNKLYETIKHKPFEYVDKFYHIHGAHRGRLS